MRADQFLAKEYFVKEHKPMMGPDEAFLAGFNAMKKHAVELCNELNNPTLGILMRAICTADVDPITGERDLD